jgi:hypothetical protein
MDGALKQTLMTIHFTLSALVVMDAVDRPSEDR